MTYACFLCTKVFLSFAALDAHMRRVKCKPYMGRQDTIPMAKEKARTFDATDAGAGETYGNGHPILRMDHVFAKGTKATLTGEVTPYDGEFGEGFFFGVKIDGKLYDFRVRTDSGNFGRIKRLGKQATLKGKSITIGILEFKGRDYLAILDGEAKSK